MFLICIYSLLSLVQTEEEGAPQHSTSHASSVQYDIVVSRHFCVVNGVCGVCGIGHV